MRDSVGYYENRRQTRLGGLGPAIAQINSHFQGQTWKTTWRVPLSEKCDEVIGNYSINNFPTYANEANQFYYPVLVEFKLKTVEQSVKKEAAINFGVWEDFNGTNDSDYGPNFKRRDSKGGKGSHCFKDP